MNVRPGNAECPNYFSGLFIAQIKLLRPLQPTLTNHKLTIHILKTKNKRAGSRLSRYSEVSLRICTDEVNVVMRSMRCDLNTSAYEYGYQYEYEV